MNIENYLPPNHVTDGSVDYTAQLQAAITANDEVQFPDYPLMVNERGLIIPSNRILHDPQLVMKATDKGSYNCIRMQKVDNVIINNAIIKGERQSHIGTSGEWGHGIAMYGCSNITLNSPQADYCWGDGLYIASSDGVPCRNITINDAACTYNRRNGLSITCVIGMTINGIFCDRTWGVLPMCGIDIEPNYENDDIQGLVINNAITGHSAEYGIAIGLSELANKVVNIKIVDHLDYSSKAALRASFNRTSGVSGVIDIISPQWKANSIAPWQVDIRTDDIVLNILDPKIQVNLTQAEITTLLSKKENVNANYKLSF